MSTTTQQQAKQVAKIKARQQKRNTQFCALNKAGQRTMVAKDVLKMLDDRKLKARFDNTYVSLPKQLTSSEQELSTVLELNVKSSNPCTVCGIGAAMVCDLLIKDHLKLGSFYMGDDTDPSNFEDYHVTFAPDTDSNSPYPGDIQWSQMVSKTFPESLLRLIEKAFERGSYGYDKCRSANGRLGAIYANIVANKGVKFSSYDRKTVVWGR